MSEIYDAISKIGAEIVKDGGISKDRKNQSQGYAFRGVEDFLNVLAPLLPKHRVVIAPRLMRRELFERTTAKGGTMFHAIAEYEFDFISAADGSKLTVGPVIGEAMDSGDKAHNKTLSMAYKYAVMIAFCIPTNVEDADAETHAVIATVNKQTGEITGRVTPPTPAPAIPEMHLPPPVHVPSVSGNGDKTKRAAVRTKRLPEMVERMKSYGYIAADAKTESEFYHIATIAGKAGFEGITDDNLGQVWQAVSLHFENKRGEPETEPGAHQEVPA